MRHTKMAEWMENVEKSISRIMADKVYTSAEFKRERDNFHALCKDLERADEWMMGATKELDDIKNSCDKMAPEDRVARTMDLQEDIAAKVEIIKKNAENEASLLPQGDKVPQDAQEFKDELNR